MIAAPCLSIVLEHPCADFADGGLPGCAIAGCVAHDQIGSSVQIGALVERARGVNIADANLAFLLVAETGELLDELLLETTRFGLAHDPMRLAAFQIQIQPAQAERISPRAV